MSVLNIGGDKSDKSYRYKMPSMITKIEGRGNGIKTVIVNMVDVAKSLHIHPAYPTKYFGIELGAQSSYDADKERAVVNGKHDTSTLAQHLEKFIEQFILCPGCGLPEINMSVKKETIKIACAACGYHNPLVSTHKLVTFIVRNPPKSEKKKDSSKDATKDPKETKGKKKKNRGPDDETPDEEEKKAEEPKPTEAVVLPAAVPSEAVQWFSDTSRDAMEKRQQEEMRAAQQVAEVANKRVADLTKETPVSVMKMFMGVPRTPQEIVAEARRLQLARGLNDSQKSQTIVQSLIDTAEPKTVPAQFVKHAPVFALMATDRPSTLVLINCIEEVVGSMERKSHTMFPKILQQLYEKDVLGEEVILSWYESPPESSWLVSRPLAIDLRKRSKALIEWLKDAEEEDEDDDE